MSFEESVVEHVLERLLVDIDKGESSMISFVNYNTDGTYSAQNREVNVKHSIVSAVHQRITQDSDLWKRLTDKLERTIGSDDFNDKLAAAAAQKLIGWLDEENRYSYGNSDKFPNRAAFNKQVRTKMIEIVAKRQADKMMAEGDDNVD